LIAVKGALDSTMPGHVYWMHNY